MATTKRIISILLCIAVFAGVFTTASYAFPGITESEVQEDEAPAEQKAAPDAPTTVFGLFEVGPAMARIINAFPAIQIFLVPFLVFYEIPYVLKDIFTSLGDRFSD